MAKVLWIQSVSKWGPACHDGFLFYCCIDFPTEDAPVYYLIPRMKGFILLIYFSSFWDRIFLCSPGWLQTHDSPASAFWVLRSYVYTTAPDSVETCYKELFCVAGYILVVEQTWCLRFDFQHSPYKIRNILFYWGYASQTKELQWQGF